MAAIQGRESDRFLRILLLSENPDDHLQVTRSLRPEFPGLEVEQVKNKNQLASALANGGFDLAFVDSSLSWSDCRSVVRTLHTRFPDCPIILMADATGEEIILRAIAVGLDGYVIRTAQQIPCLRAAVRLALERARERRAMQGAESGELERAKTALRESEERFRTIIEQSPISIQVLTPDGWTIQVNRAWEKLWGVTAADVRGYNMLHDEQANSLGMMPYVERGFAGEMVTMPPVAYHTPESLRAGRRRWFQARIYPVKDDRGEIRNVIMMYEDITERQWAAEDRQKLSAELMNAQEAERKRISQELHDELGQALTAMRINLAAMERDLSAGVAMSRRKLAETSMLVDEMLDHVRELSHALHPTMLDDLGLVPTLRWYSSRYAERLGIEVEFEATDLQDRLAAEMETSLYRIVQEALTNIAKYARAGRVYLSLSRQKSSVTALIEDDGIGFDVQETMAADALHPGAGLFGMRERVALWGGTFNIRSHPGQGTRLWVELPLSPQIQEASHEQHQGAAGGGSHHRSQGTALPAGR